MKIIEFIKSSKFLDIRRNICANLIVISFCILFILNIIHMNTDYPPPTFEDRGEGLIRVLSKEEEKIDTLEFICLFINILLIVPFLIEVSLRAIVEFIYKKFFPNKIGVHLIKFKFKFPKPIIFIYSFFFYITFIPFILSSLVILFMSIDISCPFF